MAVRCADIPSDAPRKTSTNSDLSHRRLYYCQTVQISWAIAPLSHHWHELPFARVTLVLLLLLAVPDRPTATAEAHASKSIQARRPPGPLLVEPLNLVVLCEDGPVLEPAVLGVGGLLGVEAVEGGLLLLALVAQPEEDEAGPILWHGGDLDAAKDVGAICRGTDTDEVEVVDGEACQLSVAQVGLGEGVSCLCSFFGGERGGGVWLLLLLFREGAVLLVP